MYMKQVPVSNLVPVNSQKENTNLVEIRLPKKFSALYLQPADSDTCTFVL